MIKNLIVQILEIQQLNECIPKTSIKPVILAAGKAERLKVNMPKVLYPICGKANLEYLLDTLMKC